MNFKLIRFLDKYIGIPICLTLKLTDIRKKSTINLENPKKILLIKFWGVGSVILASPLVSTLRKRFPKSKIFFLTMSKNRGLYEKNSMINSFIYSKIEGVGSSLGFLNLINSLRKERFDLVVDLEQFSRTSTIISYLSGAKTRIGFNTKGQWREILYTKKANFDDNLYIVENYLNLAKKIGIEAKYSKLVPITFSKKDTTELERILKKNKIKKTDRLIGINVNASNFAKQRRWPMENFIKLTDSIIEEYGKIKIVFTGSKEELFHVDKVVKPIKRKRNIVNLAGKINLKQLAVLMKRFKFFISNDSGPLHLAVAMNCPTISFFGPETPILYAPKNSNHTVFYKKFRCSPCITVYNAKNTTCKDNICLKAITPKEVMNDINKRMSRLR
tara:strand:+ start:267 stop:1427 length:1161 start_codon:yes stop_codon:yes gene_type:complete